MPIEAAEPTVIPATEAKVFDKWWIASIACSTQVDAETGANVTPFRATFVKYREIGPGLIEFAPGTERELSLDDLLAEAAVNPVVGEAVTLLMASLANVAVEKQVIAIGGNV